MTQDALRRRAILRAAATLVAAGVALPAGARLAGLFPGAADPLPGSVGLSAGAAVDPAFHLLARAAWGARPGDVERVRAIGAEIWIDEQLAWEKIDDSACDGMVERFREYDAAPNELMSVRQQHVERDLQRVTLVRAVHSRRRLYEVMCGFWRDHFSIQTAKKGCRETVPLDDRSVIRPHALGRFRDMVRASALSPAMLHYLDGAQNAVSKPGDRPNENYARELLELHTLGVRGGYTQRDVMEAARCLTGWTIVPRRGFENAFRHGSVEFRRDRHDDGEKTVLGVRIPAGGGEADLDRLLDVVCAHPSTARHVSRRLCRKFVADPAPEALVESAADVFAKTGGQIGLVVRHILTSSEFAASEGALVKRPFEFMVSALRATGATCRADDQERRFLERMGHVPFHYPTPDGYPLEVEPWMGTLLWRWNFALALVTDRLGDTKCDLADLAKRCGLDPARDAPSRLAPLFLGRDATAAERDAIDAYAATPDGGGAGRGSAAVLRAEAVALLLCTPSFQVT